MVWTPIPRAAANAFKGLFVGPPWLVLFRIGLLAAGVLVIFYILSAFGGLAATWVVWVVMFFALGWLIQAILRDLWNVRFWSPSLGWLKFW